MELLSYWKVLRKRLWLIILMIVVAGGSAFFYARQRTPLYTTSTTLFLNSGLPDVTYATQSVATAGSLANTYIAFMRTRRFADLVAGQLDPPLSADLILSSLKSEWVANTQFFKISATRPDPAVAQQLANTAAEVFIAENIARQQQQQQQLAAQQEPATATRLQQLTSLQTSLEAELALADDQIKSLEAQVAELEALSPSAENDSKILSARSDLAQQQSRRASLFGSLAQIESSLLSAGASKGGPVAETAVVIDPAPLPQAPMSRGTVRSTLLAMGTAALLAVGLAFLLEYLDWTIRTPEELDAVYGSATLGVVGVIRAARTGEAVPSQLVTLAHPHSSTAEAYRSLRTNLRFSNPGHQARSLLVTSAAPLEGKSTTAANLAIVLAQGGSHVILVDADLRRPSLHRIFGTTGQLGLTDLIVDGTEAIETYLQPTAEPNLRVLPSGPLPRNPAELLGSERCAEVMRQLREHADIVVYDSPPAGTVTDAVVLASRVDGVLHVVRAGGSRRDVVLRVKGMLEKVGGHVLGPVLNMVGASDTGYYQYYYYGYYREKEGANLPMPSGRAEELASMPGEPAEAPAPAAGVLPLEGREAARGAYRSLRLAGWWRLVQRAGGPWLLTVLGWAAGLAAGAGLSYAVGGALSGLRPGGIVLRFVGCALLGLVAGSAGGLSTALVLRRAGCMLSRTSVMVLVGGWTGVWVVGQLALALLVVVGLMGTYGWVSWGVYGALVGAGGGAITGRVLRLHQPAARIADVAAGWAGALAVIGALAFVLGGNGFPNPLASLASAGASGFWGVLAAGVVGAVGGAIGATVTLRELYRARGAV